MTHNVSCNSPHFPSQRLVFLGAKGTTQKAVRTSDTELIACLEKDRFDTFLVERVEVVSASQVNLQTDTSTTWLS